VFVDLVAPIITLVGMITTIVIVYSAMRRQIVALGVKLRRLQDENELLRLELRSRIAQLWPDMERQSAESDDSGHAIVPTEESVVDLPRATLVQRKRAHRT
jgi:hypothetical protein